MKIYGKIYIEEQNRHGVWRYVASTTRYETCKEAKDHYVKGRGFTSDKAETVRAVFYSADRAMIYRMNPEREWSI